MIETTKSTQLQIRVTSEEKNAILSAAKNAGMDMSAYVRVRVLGNHQLRFADLMRRLANESGRSYVFAELHDLLVSLSSAELRLAVETAPPANLPAEVANYVAAMIEQVCAKHGLRPPAWTREIEPLKTPMFGSALKGLRLHLLTHAPASFRRRNVFIDTSIGGRV